MMKKNTHIQRTAQQSRLRWYSLHAHMAKALTNAERKQKRRPSSAINQNLWLLNENVYACCCCAQQPQRLNKGSTIIESRLLASGANEIASMVKKHMNTKFRQQIWKECGEREIEILLYDFMQLGDLRRHFRLFTVKLFPNQMRVLLNLIENTLKSVNFKYSQRNFADSFKIFRLFSEQMLRVDRSFRKRKE